MQTQDLRKTRSSGLGVHVCHKCGWPFPNPHPSAKQRRSHKKICGSIEGSKLGSSEERKPNLKAADDDDDVNKSPSNGLSMVEKATERSISIMSRSDSDVYSDAKTDFGDPPAVAGYVAIRERAVVKLVMQDLSEGVGENSVAGANDLYPPNIGDDVECSRPEKERLEIDTSSQLQLSSSTSDSVSSSDSSVKEASVSESTLQCSKIDIVPDSVEKGNLEAVQGKNSEDVANQSFETVARTSEAILCPQKVNGDSTEFRSEVVEVEVVDNNHFSKEDYFHGEISNSRNGTAELETSEDLTKAPFESAMNTVSVPQLTTVNSLEYFPASAVMEDQAGESDVEVDCFSKADALEQINGTEEAIVVEASNSLSASVIPDYFTSKELSLGGVIDDNEGQKTEKIPDDVTLDLAQEAKYVDRGIYEKNKEAEPIKSQNKNSEDMISEALEQEDYSSEENRMKGHVVDADAVVAVSDTNLHSCINNVKPIRNDLEHDEKEVQMSDTLDADSNKVEEEKIPLTTDGVVDYVVRSGEVEENLSLPTQNVAQSEYQMDDKVEIQRGDEYGSAPIVSVEDSKTEVNLVSTNQVTNANLTEDAVFVNNAENHFAQQDDGVIFQDAKEFQNSEQPSGKVDLGLISDHDDDIVSTQNTANKKDAGDGFTEKKDESLVQQEEPVQESDVQVDSVSPTDSVEGNWGSVSVVSSFSDAPGGTEKANLQPKSDALKQPKDIKPSLEHQNENEPELKTSEQANEKANDSPVSKKNEGIIAKVTNWSTASGKHQHMSLKSILGGSSSPKAADYPPLKKPQEPEEPGNDGVKGEEWNSPARYPTNINREKGKVRSRPYWAPFLCCSSSNY